MLSPWRTGSRCFGWAAALLLLLLLLLPTAQAAGCDLLTYRRVQASAHVHVFQAAEAVAGIVNGNIVAVLGRESILLVDTGQFPGSGRRVLNELRALSPLPVRYIINTHWHGDHLLANSVFVEAFPEAEVLAHSHTIAEAEKRYGGDYAARTVKGLADALPQFRKQMEDAADEEERLWLRTTLECAESVLLPEARHTRYAASTRAVDTEMEVDLGGLKVVVKHLGSGNTPGDLVVWVQADRLVATGDLVVYPTPYAIGSDLAPWPATLDRLLEMDADLYVPGHGPILRDTAYIRDVRELVESAGAQLAALHRQGADRQEAARRLDTARFHERYLTTALRRQSFRRYFTGAAVQRYWSAMEAATAAPKPD